MYWSAPDINKRRDGIRKMLFAKVLKYEGDNKTFVWKHPAEDFNTGSQLIVHQSQEAVFFQNGRLLDMFGPGRHTLRTENLPIITSLMNLATGGRNAFHCELYFVNKTEQMAIPWGTDSKIQYLDPVYQFPIELGACGEMSIALENVGKVLVKILGNEKILTQEQLGEKLRVFVMKYVKSVIPNLIRTKKISVFDLDMYIPEFANEIKSPLAEEFKDYGFDLRKFSIMTILKPDEDPNYIKFKQLHYKRINAVTEAEIRQRVGVIDAQTLAQKKVIDAEAQARKRMLEGYTYQQEKAFGVADRIAENDAVAQMGNIGIGMGMMTGVGGVIGNTVGGILSDTMTPVTENTSPMNCNTGGFCPHCGNRYNVGALFCEKCGTKLTKKTCPQCGNELSDGALFCSKCGTKIVD